MATEQSRTFDHDAARVQVVIADNYGKRSFHTIYVAGAAGVPDVDAEVARLCAATDAEQAVIRARMVAAGWAP